MRLFPGEDAPNFIVSDIFGKKICLTDFEGKKLLICFFRYAGCPFCNLSLFRLAAHVPEFEAKGLSLVAFFQSPEPTLHKYPGKLQVPFPLISDPDKKIYNAYGVESSFEKAVRSITKIPVYVEAVLKYKFVQGKMDGDAFLMPAYFLIDQNQKIYKAKYGLSMAEDVPMIDIQEFILF